MNEVVINIRAARPSDATALAAVHDVSWREAYRGIIPGVALERMIAYRGPGWWQKSIARTRSLIVLDIGERIAGYASFGASRSFSLPQQGEISELYLDPVFQGLGLGTQLFATARRELAMQRRRGLVVWALQDNERAARFYERLGGRAQVNENIRVGGVSLMRTAFVFP
ncbi:ribosomal protein S18 acetylase RimI-like enzyme [Pseudochelatococcus lubricantis]|uniref:Ribosomal protein S18 acetylase RimI-like enzyme n=1 Tax=Pseudochelatococcus lubricantis TaxID=1538102 RepID=A0ABX0V1D7_9HYPH|nr:GNAT family N-acetyltransferase [Pseudochelatococcus lubricantis]NIJ58379.1 ribosomal protein S18 acetylase RimI-like enzyme [Pseudochelatococcus lubricantis]